MNTIDLVTQKIHLLPPDKQEEVLDFIEFLMIKYQPETSRKSAEELTIERMKDLDDPDNPDKWETVVDIGDEIDENALNEWLEKRGYKKTVSNQTT
ncbi:DUF2281 domain-containing protein [Crocosphaera sp.]|uniref:DUF2281 domain-containing protein n=1 Tax=Crocosphaera sp. TaxID=2729996 RepID=UPI00260D1C37|nr:DUF2281 domain-containing protein [Crocosphaera sp.]MDJ0583393.1 DUF2281 domain-containing protein [Crocosphaera sp.]